MLASERRADVNVDDGDDDPWRKMTLDEQAFWTRFGSHDSPCVAVWGYCKALACTTVKMCKPRGRDKMVALFPIGRKFPAETGKVVFTYL